MYSFCCIKTKWFFNWSEFGLICSASGHFYQDRQVPYLTKHPCLVNFPSSASLPFKKTISLWYRFLCCISDSLLSSLSQLSISTDVSMLFIIDSVPPLAAVPGDSGDRSPPPPDAPPPANRVVDGHPVWFGDSESLTEDVGERRGK